MAVQEVLDFSNQTQSHWQLPNPIGSCPIHFNQSIPITLSLGRRYRRRSISQTPTNPIVSFSVHFNQRSQSSSILLSGTKDGHTNMDLEERDNEVSS